jgi:hypothetical protein
MSEALHLPARADASIARFLATTTGRVLARLTRLSQLVGKNPASG